MIWLIFTLEANDVVMIVTQTRRVAMPFKLSREAQFFKNSVSGREKEVLRLMSSGHTSLEIAQSLFISEHTVISHRKNLMIKLGARNSAHLVMKGVQFGLLS